MSIPPKKPSLWGRILSFLIVFAMLASLAIVREGTLFGHKFTHEAPSPADSIAADGTLIVNTSTLAQDVSGYGGPVPLHVYVSKGRVDSVAAMPNAETPGFFKRVEKAGLLKAWDGKTLAEAAEITPDAVSGATFSSNAVIANAKAGISHAMGREAAGSVEDAVPFFSWAMLAAFVVAAGAALIPLFHKGKRYRLVQQLLNVGVLGFWAGTFLDYSLMLNFFANGWVPTLACVVTILLLVVGFLYPLFGRPQHYCAWVCPLGSAQDLAGRLFSNKIHIGRRTHAVLGFLRDSLWAVLLFCLWAGIFTEWIDNELFTAFIVRSASWLIMGIGIGFILLSIIIPRPFCSFVCPTGTLLRKTYDLSTN